LIRVLKFGRFAAAGILKRMRSALIGLANSKAVCDRCYATGTSEFGRIRRRERPKLFGIQRLATLLRLRRKKQNSEYRKFEMGRRANLRTPTAITGL
jgi:hypothetical protein